MDPSQQLAIFDRSQDPDVSSGPLVVLVHGSLDRGASFTRVLRRLADLPTLVYDRRGYNASRGVRPVATAFDEHVADLLEVIGGREAVVVGHSYGGNIALGAAANPAGENIVSVAAYEPPQPWLTIGRRPAPPSPAADDDDPGNAAERFFRRMVGDGAWERLSDAEKAERRADGPALAAELAAIRLGKAPFDVGNLLTPVVYGRGELSMPHHRRGVAWLVEHTPGAELFEIAGARHGAHLTHPDAFADMVRRAVARAAKPSATRS
jgi:pimeloyl-ACP methyl ester carboxylesterase